MSVSDLRGQRAGSLVAVEPVGHASDPKAGILWRCRCDCGGSALRTASQFGEAMRSGRRSSCRACIVAAWRLLVERRTQHRREQLRRAWQTFGDMITPEQSRAEESEIREQVGEELGGWCPDLPDPIEWHDSLETDLSDYAAGDEAGMSIAEIGRELGLSREGVRQIVVKALRKLRRKSLRFHLHEFR